jgi:hypothetical protein
MKRILSAFILWLLFASVAFAQGIGATKDIAVPSGSGSFAFQLTGALFTYPSLLIVPAIGTTTEIRWVSGPNSGALANATSPVLPPGGVCYAPGSSNQYISFYGVTVSATVHITQVTLCPPGIGFAASSGGGGTGTTPSVGVIGQPVPGSADYTGIMSTTGSLVGASGSLWGTAPTGLNVLGVNANILSTLLPINAATATNQTLTQSGAGALTSTLDNVQGNPNGTPVPVSGFKPTPAYVPLSVGASSTRVALPVNPPNSTIVVENMGPNPACVLLGGSGVAATSSGPLCTASEFVAGNSSVSYSVGTSTFIAAIQTTTGATSLMISGGSGLYSGAGGGGSTTGSGGGGSGGPLGSQPISNSQAVNPAVASQWSTLPIPNSMVTGTITGPDSNQICSSAGWGNQTACIGAPSNGSAVQLAVSSAGYLWVQASTTGGTPTVNFAIRISNDGGTTWFNRGIFELTNVSPFQINNIVSPNFAGWLTGGVTNVEVIATTYVGAGSTAITITQGQATPFVTSSATSSSINGTGASAATNIQGNGVNALSVGTNLQQLANVALAAPTAWGVAPTNGSLVPDQNVNCVVGCAASSLISFTPTGSTLTTPLVPAGGAVSSVALPAGGSAELISNTGTSVAYARLTVGSGTATINDVPIQPGAGCVLGINITGGPATFVNIYAPAAGVSVNVVSGAGLGNCPTGGGGSSASGGSGGGNLVQTTVTIPIHLITATTTRLITGVTGQFTDITGWDILAAGAGNIELVAGTTTTTACDTGQHALTGNYQLTAQAGQAKSATGASFVVPVNQDVCAITSAAISYDGSMQYTQSSTPLTSFGGGSGGGGNLVQTTATIPVHLTTATTTKLITGISGQFTDITGWDILAAGAGNFELVAGTTTTTSCDTGQHALTGNYQLTAQAGQVKSATGAVFVVPINQDVCAITSAPISYDGSVQYTQSATPLTSFGGGGSSGGSGGSGGTFNSANVGLTGQAAPTSANLIGTVDNAGNLQGVSASNPTPVIIVPQTLSVACSTCGVISNAPPASAGYMGANSNGAIKGLIQTGASVVASPSTAGTTQIVGLIAANFIYVTSYDGTAASGTWQLVYGTGTNCATGQNPASGVYTANGQQQGAGIGLGAVIVVPAGNELCVATNTATQYSIRVAYSQSP